MDRLWPASFSGQLHLGLFERVFFVDWHGVLSTDFFWHSILSQRPRAFHRSFIKETDKVFAEPAKCKEWMRGHLTSEDIVGNMTVSVPSHYRPDYLLRRLREDCKTMSIQHKVRQLIERLKHDAYVVLATDNMDCFAEAVRTRSDVRSLIDDVICSSWLGHLKKEAPELFFQHWLESRQLEIGQATLIDDCQDTCKAFKQLGGDAIWFQNPKSLEMDLAVRGY